MKVLTTAFLAMLITMFCAYNSQGQSFNCRYAKEPTEVAICKYPDLSGLDEKMAILYSSLVNTLTQRQATTIRTDQPGFLRKRNSCGFDRDCITRSYSLRIAELCEFGGSAADGCESNSIPSAKSASISELPWLVKSQEALSLAECKGAQRHDSYYWWAKGKCHLKEIRYAAGVVTEDTAASEDPSSIVKKGELLTEITQFRPTEGLYCLHGGFCYPATSIQLLGSMTTGPDSYKMSDETDLWERVGSSCELRLRDRAAIESSKADFLLEGCH